MQIKPVAVPNCNFAGIATKPTGQDARATQQNHVSADAIGIFSRGRQVRQGWDLQLNGVTWYGTQSHQKVDYYRQGQRQTRVAKVEKAAADVVVLQEQVAKLTIDLEDRKQWARMNNVPKKKNENLFKIAANIGKLCDYPVSKEQINYIALHVYPTQKNL